jgi:mono/diheme cytochrome c family protein
MALSALLTLTSGFKEQAATGAQLYKQHCARCHGADGTKGFLGARNLQKSTLPDAAIQAQIQNGKGFMPSFRNKITGDQLGAVLLYVKSLRKN